jgi:sensor c-di-GMP phosphodiesterase-like protein
MIGRLFGFLAVSLVIGAPLVAYIWDSVNRIVAGDYRRLVVALPLLVLFSAFLALFARQLQRRLEPDGR